MTAEKNHRGKFKLVELSSRKCFIMFKHGKLSEILLKCSKLFIEWREFLLEKWKSIFVPSELSFKNLRSWKLSVVNLHDFSSKIYFHRKFILSLKSPEKLRISVKCVCMTCAQYCT